jgi:hypothetical protein
MNAIMAHQTILIGSGISLSDLVENLLLVELFQFALEIEVAHVLNIGSVTLRELLLLIPPSPTLFRALCVRRWLRRRLKQWSVSPALASLDADIHVISIPRDFGIHCWRWICNCNHSWFPPFRLLRLLLETRVSRGGGVYRFGGKLCGLGGWRLSTDLLGHDWSRLLSGSSSEFLSEVLTWHIADVADEGRAWAGQVLRSSSEH